MICLLGINGAGKSTLLRTLAGIIPPIEGEVLLNNKSIHQIKRNELAKKLSVVLTDKIDVNYLKTIELIALGRYPYMGWLGGLDNEDEAKIEWAMEATDTKSLAHKYILELSDGERQKVLIARALAQDAPLIFLDEPTAHLDISNKFMIFGLLHRLTVEAQKAIVMATHDLELALQVADKLWVIQPNQTVTVGIPEDLVLNGYIEGLFAKQDFFFNKSMGCFQIQYHSFQKKEIYLEGEGEVKYWTERLLQRTGFKIQKNMTSDAITIRIKQENQKIFWILDSEMGFESLEKLLANLLGKYSNDVS
jgi:iron complex transport system ATP-binding protein